MENNKKELNEIGFRSDLYDFFISQPNKRAMGDTRRFFTENQLQDILDSEFILTETYRGTAGNRYVYKDRILNKDEFLRSKKEIHLYKTMEDFNKVNLSSTNREFFYWRGKTHGFSENAVNYFLTKNYTDRVHYKHLESGFSYICGKDTIKEEIKFLADTYGIQATEKDFKWLGDVK